MIREKLYQLHRNQVGARVHIIQPRFHVHSADPILESRGASIDAGSVAPMFVVLAVASEYDMPPQGKKNVLVMNVQPNGGQPTPTKWKNQ